MDIFWTPVFVGSHSMLADQRVLLVYNFFAKLFYIITSIYVVAIMMWKFPRTREREKAWKLGSYCAAASAILSPLVALMFKGFPLENPYGFRFTQVSCWKGNHPWTVELTTTTT